MAWKIQLRCKICNYSIYFLKNYLEITTVFIFSFCIRLVTQLNDSVLGVLKHNYITKKIRELLTFNSRFLIHNSLNQLLYYTNIKENCLFAAETVETLDLNN